MQVNGTLEFCARVLQHNIYIDLAMHDIVLLHHRRSAVVVAEISSERLGIIIGMVYLVGSIYSLVNITMGTTSINLTHLRRKRYSEACRRRASTRTVGRPCNDLGSSRAVRIRILVPRAWSLDQQAAPAGHGDAHVVFQDGSFVAQRVAGRVYHHRRMHILPVEHGAHSRTHLLQRFELAANTFKTHVVGQRHARKRRTLCRAHRLLRCS